eukprot:4992755-Prymnesium_polylepis.1
MEVGERVAAVSVVLAHGARMRPVQRGAIEARRCARALGGLGLLGALLRTLLADGRTADLVRLGAAGDAERRGEALPRACRVERHAAQQRAPRLKPTADASAVVRAAQRVDQTQPERIERGPERGAAHVGIGQAHGALPERVEGGGGTRARVMRAVGRRGTM